MTIFGPTSRLQATSIASTVNPVEPTNLTKDVWVNITWAQGNSVITSSGFPAPFPDLTLYDQATPTGAAENQSVSGGVLTTATDGNRTARVFGNSVIDNAFRLDQFSGTNRIKYFFTRLYRGATAYTASTHERIFQYGASGASSANDGGMVMRINYGTIANQGNADCIIPALHWDYGQKAGSSDDLIIGYTSGYEAGFEGPSTRSMKTDNGDYTSTTGHVVCYAVEKNYDGSGYAAIHLYTDDDTRITYKDQGWNGAPHELPGPSIDTPTGATDSGGFTLFAQSVDSGAAILKDCKVWPIWIGEAYDRTHLETIISRLKTDITRVPYY